MIKILSIILSTMIVLVASFFSDPESNVSISAEVPARIVPGEDCLVTVTLITGNVTGYAQLQQVLPVGLKAKAVETAGARFEMQDNVLGFVWTELPIDNPLTISYVIQTDPNETSTLTLNGAFVYMQNDQAVTVEMAPASLHFSGGSQSASANHGEVQRKIIAVTPEGGQYNVEITIRKKEGEYTARFTDNIPEGYTVTNINPCNAKFMFSNKQATFVWNELPAEKTFMISYTLEATSTSFVNPAVDGMLVYGAEGETQTSIATTNHEFLMPSVQPVPPPAAASAAPTQAEAIHTAPPETVPDVIESNLIAQAAETPQASENAAPQNFMTAVPSPQNGVFFKIQIAATRKSPVRNDQYFENKYHLGQHVDVTEHEGWRKYMLGHFDSFMSAHNFSLRIREKIPDAFVVAYRNAERVPLKEAVSGTLSAN